MPVYHKDLSGKIFHNIKVLEFSGISPRGDATYTCKCLRCGNTFVAIGHRLTNKNRPQKDCGCSFAEKRQDLSGKTFGGLKVLYRNGKSKSGDIVYRCRCLSCGRIDDFPACTIRSNPKGCGCQHGLPEKMAELSKLAMPKVVIDGVNVYSATKVTPNVNNSTGYRWVVIQEQKGKQYIKATFYIRGKRYYKGGFLSPESAYEWAKAEHDRVLASEGIQNPRAIGADKNDK